MDAPYLGLNRFLAEAKPSATYKMIDRVAGLRASGKPIISLTAVSRISTRRFMSDKRPLQPLSLAKHAIPRWLG